MRGDRRSTISVRGREALRSSWGTWKVSEPVFWAPSRGDVACFVENGGAKQKNGLKEFQWITPMCFGELFID